MTDNGTITEALSRVMGKIGRIEKSAKAPQEMGGFKFVPITAVMDALQPALVDEGIIILPRVELLRMDEYTTSGGKASRLATVHVQLLARRGSEEILWTEGIGQGADTSDKAPGKATTGAVKQALLNALAVPTGDDPDGHAVEAARPRQQAAAETRKRMTMGELRDRVLALAAETDLPLEALDKILADEVGKSFAELTTEELIDLGTRLKRGDYAIPFEHEQPALTPDDAREAPSVPAAQSQEGDPLQAVLDLTGGTLEQPAVLPAGDGGGPVPPAGPAVHTPTRDAREAAAKARARAGAA